MWIANFRATTKNGKIRTITNMLRKKRKWNHIQCLFKTTKAIKRVKDRRQKQRKMATNRK